MDYETLSLCSSLPYYTMCVYSTRNTKNCIRVRMLQPQLGQTIHRCQVPHYLPMHHLEMKVFIIHYIFELLANNQSLLFISQKVMLEWHALPVWLLPSNILELGSKCHISCFPWLLLVEASRQETVKNTKKTVPIKFIYLGLHTSDELSGRKLASTGTFLFVLRVACF